MILYVYYNNIFIKINKTTIEIVNQRKGYATKQNFKKNGENRMSGLDLSQSIYQYSIVCSQKMGYTTGLNTMIYHL